jgi:hypothetical protein
MCYTAKDSLIGYIINSISSILLYNISNDAQYKVMALFLLFVGQMQIFDFAFWMNPECNLLNQLTTKLAIGVNHLQPIVLFILQYTYGFKQSPLSLILLSLYAVMGLIYNFKAFNDIDCTLAVKGIMKWEWNHLPGNTLYYTLFLGYLVAASFNFKDNLFAIISALVIVLTFFIANKTPILNKSSGRIWCYYAAFMPLVFVALKYFNLS